MKLKKQTEKVKFILSKILKQKTLQSKKLMDQIVIISI